VGRMVTLADMYQMWAVTSRPLSYEPNFSHLRNKNNVDHTYPKPYYSFSRASITLK